MINRIQSKCVLNPNKFNWDAINYAANYDKNETPTYGTFPTQQQTELEVIGIDCNSVQKTTTLFSSPYKCNEFFFCNNYLDQFDACGMQGGALRYIQCPRGKYFNENYCRCIRIYEKKSSLELLLPPFKCTCNELKCLYNATMYADAVNCGKYFTCHNDRFVSSHCKDGMHFSMKCQQCVGANSEI